MLDRELDAKLRSVGGDGDLFVSTTYIGDCGIDELRRVSSEYILDRSAESRQHQQAKLQAVATAGQKSVKIHPNVTEFHYPGD